MEKYNVICLLWMIRYISLFATHLHSGFILVHSGVLTSLLHHNGVDTSMTLDAAKWNGAGGDLSSCVTNIILDHISYYSEYFWNKFTS